MKLRNPFRRKLKPHHSWQYYTDNLQMVSVGGKVYYTFKDLSQMPTLRLLEVMHLIGELTCGPIDREYLVYFAKALENNLQSNKLADAVRLADDLKNRLSFNTTKRHVLGVCAALYLEPDENPVEHNYDRAAKKVHNWLRGGVDAFFLSKPIAQLWPELPDSEASFESFLRAGLPQWTEIKSLSELLRQLSLKESESPELSSLKQRILTLEGRLK